MFQAIQIYYFDQNVPRCSLHRGLHYPQFSRMRRGVCPRAAGYARMSAFLVRLAWSQAGQVRGGLKGGIVFRNCCYKHRPHVLSSTDPKNLQYKHGPQHGPHVLSSTDRHRPPRAFQHDQHKANATAA